MNTTSWFCCCCSLGGFFCGFFLGEGVVLFGLFFFFVGLQSKFLLDSLFLCHCFLCIITEE